MSQPAGDRVSEVLARLAAVTDPELDEPVTELGFVTDVSVDAGGHVGLGFRLPTYWCAANFSYLMADDMRRAVLALPWVAGVTLVIGEHMYADTINRAMAEGLGFREAFGAEADGDLDALRRVFDIKAFQRRQLALLDHLLAQGYEVAAVLGLSVAGLRGLEMDQVGVGLVARYLARRDVPSSAGDAAPAFVDAAGQPVSVANFAAHRRVLRNVVVNVEFNGALCRGLLAARFADAPPAVPAEPGLLDFVCGRVPARA